MHKNAKLYTHDGETLTLVQWEEKTGISARALAQRMIHGRTFSEAVTCGPLISKKRGKAWLERANPTLNAWLRRPAP
jgi:hypothetical protein